MKPRLTSDPLWLIPFAYAASSFILGYIVPRIEYHYAIHLGDQMSVSSAQAFLGSVTSGMMALTAIVFSLVFVFSQFSATAYSPRLTVEISRRRSVYHAFGWFIATFTYSLVSLVWVDYGRSGQVPTLSIYIVGALIAVSLIYLTNLIRSLARMNIVFVLRFIGTNGRRVVDEYLLQAKSIAGNGRRPLSDANGLPPVMLTVDYAGEPLSLARYDLSALNEQARRASAIIVLDYAVGDTLIDGSRLLNVYGGTAGLTEGELMKCIHLAPTRSFRQTDPNYAFRLLVDIAIRALSPAVNDPTTAVQALDQIEDLLTRLCRRELPTGYVHDNTGALRVVFPTPSWEDFLALGFDEIRQYGRDSIQVMRRLHAALCRLVESIDDPARQEAVRQYTQHLDNDIAASSFDDIDRASALREDAQGLGITRSERSVPTL
jgi:uncharacterized membrane protein